MPREFKSRRRYQFMYNYFEIYPEDDDSLYFIEFSGWKKEDKIEWRLFKRHFTSKEYWFEFGGFVMGKERHPWQLENGVVNQNENSVDFNTKNFLKFVVDSLNKNSEQNSQQ